MNITVRRMCPAVGLSRRDLVRAVRAAAQDHPIGSLSLVLASDALMAQLHARFMSDPTPTDVLTFDLSDEDSRQSTGIEGEIVISVETARREAHRRKLAEKQEILRYAIHGTLHLIGYDDASAGQRRRMRREEDRVLAELARLDRKSSRLGGMPGRQRSKRLAAVDG